MLSATPLRRLTNAKDVSLYRNINTGELEVHVGLDRFDPSNQDLQYISTEPDNAAVQIKLTTPELSNNAENMDPEDELPEISSSTLVLRRQLGQHPDRVADEKALVVTPHNQLQNAFCLDLGHPSNRDLKPASPQDKKSFLDFRATRKNYPNVNPATELDTFIMLRK
ncbi:MAG TPA: hypothetical protein VHM20_01825 [Gammaproteobacteria bacterium]|nr:hypothetical protein [Gammaproteobacteria bacterium]